MERFKQLFVFLAERLTIKIAFPVVCGRIPLGNLAAGLLAATDNQSNALRCLKSRK